MKILHVSLGLPPLRTGGMTRYCTEIMQAQVAAGNEVSLLFPGRYLPGKMRIHRNSWHGVTTFEVVNPLPVALTYGVGEPDAFCARCKDSSAYKDLLIKSSPDIIHVHCFQGIHREFFKEAHEAGIPIVFTTHDYYPFCPRCTLVTSQGESCAIGASPSACAVCNSGVGMTARRSRLMQTKIYSLLKDNFLVHKVGATVKREMTADVKRPVSKPAEVTVSSYARLLNYYREVFNLVDLVLANSTVAMNEYQRVFPKAHYELMPITHAGLGSSEVFHPKRKTNKPLRIGYFGGMKAYKGWDTLLEAAQILDMGGFNFELSLYGDSYGVVPSYAHATCFGRIGSESMRDALSSQDLVLVPSTYHETFGFVVLEALDAGVPVICSDVVGAKDLVEDGRIFRAGNASDLARCIQAFSACDAHDASIPFGYPISIENQLKKLTFEYGVAKTFR